MAIQQVVPITLTLVGDGTSTTFKYTISSLFAVTTSSTLKVLSSGNIPNGVSATSSLGHVTASMFSGKLQLTFTTAPAAGQQGEVNVNLFYVSQ